jgi:hypothetical protein
VAEQAISPGLLSMFGRAGPSRPSKRIAVTALALLGALVSARLAFYELGWTGPPWEPFFGDGSRRVLGSDFSRALPVPDAVLGFVGYVAEIAVVNWGGPTRYRDKPEAVHLYAVVAGIMALGSFGLVLVQVAVVRALCTLCLLSAVISFVLVMPAWTELMATRRAYP